VTRFDAVLARLEQELDVPYPARATLLAEIAADLDAAWTAARRRGLSDAAARAAALRELELDREGREELARIHRTRVGRVLAALSPRVRRAAEWAAAAAPVVTILLYLSLEVPMLDIIREGGWGMYPVILFGSIALLAALRRAFLWLVAKNHSAEVLGLEDSTPLHLALLTFFAGLLGTGTGCYKVLELGSSGAISGQELLIGIRESLGVVLLSMVFVILTILIDLGARTLLHRSGAPRVVPRP
jgi:hypothetical protein